MAGNSLKLARAKRLTRWLFAALFTVAGILHFLVPSFYLRIMPPALPFKLALVYISGAAEIILGGLLLVPPFSRMAAWGLIALLIAIYPANIHMALNPDQFRDLLPNPTAHALRLVAQFGLIGIAYWLTRPDDVA